METLAKTRIERSPSLVDQVREAICESIVAGELKSGDRLVVEQLAPALGVSQTPVREAMIYLIQDGLAIQGPDGKLQVAPLTKQYVDEIYLVRSALEGLAAELAAERFSDDGLAGLRTLLEQGSGAIELGDVMGYGVAGAELHVRIVAAAGNLTLSRELRSIHSHYMRIRNFSQQEYGEHHVEAQHEHWEIFNALAARNATLARQLMEGHIRRSGARITYLIETHG